MSEQSALPIEQEPISIAAFGKYVIFILAIILILLGILSFLSRSREVYMVDVYTQQAKKFQQENPAFNEQFFTNIFDQCEQVLMRTKTATSNPTQIFCPAAQLFFNGLNQNALEHFSSTAYMRISNNKLELIRASGDYQLSTNPNQTYSISLNNREELVDYVFQNRQIKMWQDFIGYLPGKEVLVPVYTSPDQNTHGYMFLSVIEK